MCSISISYPFPYSLTHVISIRKYWTSLWTGLYASSNLALPSLLTPIPFLPLPHDAPFQLLSSLPNSLIPIINSLSHSLPLLLSSCNSSYLDRSLVLTLTKTSVKSLYASIDLLDLVWNQVTYSVELKFRITLIYIICTPPTSWKVLSYNIEGGASFK